VVGTAPSAYSLVGELMEGLIARLDLVASRSLILRTYEDICHESLAFPLGARPPGPSRINHDGTPIQFAATVGPGARTLQFLGEAGAPNLAGRERMQANRECITAVAESLHMDGALSSVASLLDALAPETDIDLLADPGGAYWVGAAFPAGQAPHMRVYLNARWGQESGRWARLSRFAAYFGCAQWPEIATGLTPDLQPLGVAITLSPDQPPGGRIYLSAYGKRMRYYEELAEAYGIAPLRGAASLAREWRAFGQSLLGDDYAYPTQTAVCSFGMGGYAPGDSAKPDLKLELCAHCLFASDVQAAGRLRSWYEQRNLDAVGYESILSILSAGHLSDEAVDLHCYAGVGLRRGAPYGTIYIKPWIGPS
jgi:hypothetical protein